MPVVVSCTCGQRFAAEDRLIGKQVPCPMCGRLLKIAATGPPVPAAAPVAAKPAGGVRVECSTCGRAFRAPESLRGQTTKCPACGDAIAVPGFDPLNLDPLAAPLSELASASPLRSPQSSSGEVPWTIIGWMAAAGAAVLLLFFVTSAMLNFNRRAQVAAVPKPKPPRVATRPGTPQPSKPAASTPPARAPPPAAATPSPPTSEPAEQSKATSDSSSPPNSAKSGPPAASSEVGLARLPEGVKTWHQQPGAKLVGVRRSGKIETPTAHFSWLTGLLPFLGHQETYEKFNFDEPLTKGKNLQVGTTLIPEFLNPADDRQRWKGYPFDGLALSHVAGMSGVEDARNVVAADLPRSDPRAGVFGYTEVARPEQITDGKSQTVMIVGTGAMANPWVFGGGATIRGVREPLFDKTSGLGTKGLAGGGTVVVMADGSVRHVSSNIDPKVFKAMSTIHGAESVDLPGSAPPFDMKSLKKP